MDNFTETHDSLMQTWTRLNVTLKDPETIKRPKITERTKVP
jgi:hypothetical protein